jgi:transcriptional regulator with XRE-family HTH domain
MAYLREPVILMAVGDKLKNIRQQKNMTQEDLALQAGIAISQIGRIERGKLNPSVSTLFVIALALEVEPKELFNFEELFIKGKSPATKRNKSETKKKKSSGKNQK